MSAGAFKFRQVIPGSHQYRDDDRTDGRADVLFIFVSRCIDCLEKLFYTVSCHARYADGLPYDRYVSVCLASKPARYLEIFVKLVENQTHTVHQTVHVRRFAFRIPRPAVSSKSRLEFFKILHPLYRKRVRLNVRLVKDKNEWQLGFVKDAARFFENGSECECNVTYLHA